MTNWLGCEPTPEADARRLSEFVSKLPSFDEIYASWLSSRDARSSIFPVPLSEVDAAQFLRSQLRPSADNGEPIEWLGSIFSVAGHAGAPPYDFRKSSYARTTCAIGGYRSVAPYVRNSILMELSELRSLTGRPWRASELRPLMKFAREVWSPTELYAYFGHCAGDWPKIADATWAAGVRPLEPIVGWITYLPPDLAARAAYPADVEVERLGDGAALVTLCEQPFEKGDAAGLAKLRALEAALRPIQS